MRPQLKASPNRLERQGIKPMIPSLQSNWFIHNITMAPLSLLYRQGSHRLEKYLNMKGFLEKSLKMKYALKSTGESLKGLEKYLNLTIFCKT